MDTALTPDQRADQLLAQMTIDEKIALLHGANGSYVGNVPANTRLGIPALNLEDGPAGVGDGMTQVTAFPAPIAGAASWDTSLMQQYGQALGSEQMGKGANVVLGPTVNILRNPQWGRSFESFGEDPYLSGQLAVADVDGIQSQNAIATVKHYAANSQEYDRTSVSANIDERTLHEIYLPAFEAAVQQGQAGAVMCSYNRINDVYACEQAELLNQVLKQEWGFPGFVVSDWGATHSTVAAANAGLDMQMPDASFYGAALKTAVTNGQVSMATINDHVHRILRTMFAVGLFDHPTTGSPSNNVASAADAQLALQEDEQGSVLLKNNQNVLPFNTSQIHSIAVIGADASISPKVVGGGSAGVNPPHVVTPLQCITQRAGSGISVQYAQGLDANGDLPAIPTQYLTPPTGGGNGLQAQFFNNMTLSGNPVLTRVDPNLDFNWNGGSPGAGVTSTQWSGRWSGTLTAPTTGTYAFTMTSDDGSRLYINNQLVINNWADQALTTAGGSMQLTAGQTYTIRAEYYQDGGASEATLGWNIPGQGSTLLGQAAQTAQSADAAVVFVNDNESEGSDRSSLELPGAQDQLIQAVAQANPHTIVVLNTGAPVLMPWVNQVQGILEAWYPGQEDGSAVAALLFGDVNPSGKLPMTFPVSASDVPANTPAQYPGINDEAQYSEGVFVGYRYYDKNAITPLFSFGQGLSYTTFSYSNLSVTPSAASSTSNVSVSLDVTNTGSRAGAEVAQLYLGIPSTNVAEPPKQLNGFQKVMLQPGQSQHITFTLNPQALSYWNTSANNWAVPNGTFQVMVGSSSRDIRLQGNFSVSGSMLPPPPTPTPTPTPIPGGSGLQINAGGSAASPFVVDTDFTGGTTTSTGNTIDTSGVSTPAPQAVYQSNRYGNFSYTIPNLTPNAAYTVRLYFAETYWTQVGQRTFNVSLNGQQVLSASYLGQSISRLESIPFGLGFGREIFYLTSRTMAAVVLLTELIASGYHVTN